MTKKELIENIEEHFSLAESFDNCPDVNERVNNCEIAIDLTKEYLLKYKIPYKHKYMGSNVAFNEAMIEVMKDMIIDARIFNNE